MAWPCPRRATLGRTRVAGAHGAAWQARQRLTSCPRSQKVWPARCRAPPLTRPTAPQPRSACMLLVKTLRRPLAGLICTGLVLGPVPARAEETIRCESHGFRYNYCRVDTDNRVSLVRKHGFMDCREGSSWGYDRRGVCGLTGAARANSAWVQASRMTTRRRSAWPQWLALRCLRPWPPTTRASRQTKCPAGRWQFQRL